MKNNIPEFMKFYRLNENTELPAIGLGTWRLQGLKAQKAIKHAISVGYRHFDTADYYGNHKAVGKALQSADVPREELFITTKVWRSDLKEKDVISSGKRFLKELNIEYIDLLLIHWPNSSINIKETLEGFKELKEQGLIRAIGVSNFTVNLLEKALEVGIGISANQVEFHPTLNQKELKDFCEDHNIRMIAYSPLAQGQDLKLKPIKELAEEYNRTPAQVILRWLVQKNIAAIPKSSNLKHIETNIRVFDWDLSPEAMNKIDSISSNKRMFDFGFVDFS